jgi:hypothetical protein
MAKPWFDRAWFGLLALGLPLLGGCQEELPTTTEEDLFPVEAVTVEVRLPFEEFAEGVEAWGGYGNPAELPIGIVAQSYEGSLDVRTLVGLQSYPTVASVRDTTGSIRPDTSLTFIGGKIVAIVDTLSSVHDGSATLQVGALQQDWHFRTANWTMAVDSVGDQQPWEEEGAGPVIPLGSGDWEASSGDTISIELDSAAVAVFTDTLAAHRGIRLDAGTEGVRLDLTSVRLILNTRPSINPDTLVELTVGARTRTFVYQPALGEPGDEIRVGGVPAWRSVLKLDLPEVLNGPPELCQAVGCPLTLTPDALISASLVLRTKAPPPAFQPNDSLFLDVRTVLAPDRMPKSPLGGSLTGIVGTLLPPEYFGEDAGAEVKVPLGSYIEALIEAGPDTDLPTSLALLSTYEPLSLYFASFEGPESGMGPELRLILTYGEGVGIR